MALTSRKGKKGGFKKMRLRKVRSQEITQKTGYSAHVREHEIEAYRVYRIDMMQLVYGNLTCGML